MRRIRWSIVFCVLLATLPLWKVTSQSLSGLIAYSTSAHEVWVMSGDGTASGKRKLASGDGSVFNPDGTRVAFISGAYDPSNNPRDIVIKSVQVDGTDIRDECVISQGSPAGAGAAMTLLRWSPGGKYIAMNATQNGPGFVELCDTTTHTILSQLKYVQGTVSLVFDWAADGGSVLFQASVNYPDQKDLYLGNPDTLGDAAAKITSGQLLSNAYASVGGYYYAGRLSPDGKTIAIAGSRLFFLAVPGQSSVYDTKAISKEARYGFAWSPDSKAMAVVTSDGLSLLDVATGVSGSPLSGVRSVDWTRLGSPVGIGTSSASTSVASASAVSGSMASATPGATSIAGALHLPATPGASTLASDGAVRLTFVRIIDPATDKYHTPDPDKRYVSMEIVMENTSTVSESLSISPYKMRTTDGFEYSASYSSVGGDGISVSDLLPGGKHQGVITWQIPQNSPVQWIRYLPSGTANPLFIDF